MTVIGLTGGIAMGKSTATQWFKQHHYPVVDADQIARDIVCKGSPVLEALVHYFGKAILNEDGTLNRAYLGRIVFADAQKRQALDNIMQPAIRQCIIAQLSDYTDDIVILDMPLLFEQHYEPLVDKAIVIWTSYERQLERLMIRNQLTQTEAKQRIASQWPIEKKKALADYTINNDASIQQLYTQLQRVMQQIIACH